MVDHFVKNTYGVSLYGPKASGGKGWEMKEWTEGKFQRIKEWLGFRLNQVSWVLRIFFNEVICHSLFSQEFFY